MPWALERGDPDDQPDEDPGIHGRRQADRLDGRARRGPRPRRPRLRRRRRRPSSSSWRSAALDRFDDGPRRGRRAAGRASSGWDATAEAMRRLIAEAPRPAPAAAPRPQRRPARVEGRRRQEPDRRRRPRRPERGAAPGRPRLPPGRQARPRRRPLPVDRPGRIHVRLRRPHLLHERQVRRRPLPRRPRRTTSTSSSARAGSTSTTPTSATRSRGTSTACRRPSSRNACSGVIEASRHAAPAAGDRRQRQRQRPRRAAAELPGVEPPDVRRGDHRALHAALQLQGLGDRPGADEQRLDRRPGAHPVARRGDRGGPPARPAATWARTPGSATRCRAAARCSSPAWPSGSGPGAGRSTPSRTLVKRRPEAAAGDVPRRGARATTGPAARRSATRRSSRASRCPT